MTNENIKTVEVLNSNDIPQMIMTFNSIDWNSDFNDDYFDLNSIVDKIELNNEGTKNNAVTENNETETNKKETNDTGESNANGTDKKEENGTKSTEQSSVIDDIIYPLYIPTGTSLTEQEKVSKTDGERIILTFDGEKPFLLVEETSCIDEEFSVIPTFGEPYMLADTIGALTENSITWSSNGIDYYIVSDAMSQLELIEIASSISAIPTMK